MWLVDEDTKLPIRSFLFVLTLHTSEGGAEGDSGFHAVHTEPDTAPSQELRL